MRTLRTTRIIHVAGNLLWAFGGQFIEPINELGIASTLLDETAQAVTTIAPALVAGDAQQIELADEIAEYGCAVAGHGAVFLVKLDGLRIMAGQNWWVLHNTAAVSA
ncbi:MAG: hypothetical protein WCB22_20580, partial [Pseudolabrys sp.]